MEAKFGAFRSRLAAWAALGKVDFPGGGGLFGHVPSLGSRYYLHALYDPLTDRQLSYLESKIGFSLPDDIKSFYRRANGCSIFGGKMGVYGLIGPAERERFELMLSQPIDVVMPARSYRRHSPSGQGICVKWYDDKTKIFVEPGNTLACVDVNGRVLRVMENCSIMDWLIREFDRLLPFFSSSGFTQYSWEDMLPRWQQVS